VGLSTAGFAGCGRSVDPDRAPFSSGNFPPTTAIVNPVLSGDETTYNLLVSWKGYDEDGTVAGFEVAVDETSSWRFTTAFDSLFVFRAEQCCVTDTIESDGSTRLDSLAYRFHRLFVRALDNEGAEDRSPVAMAFTATNVFPTTLLLRGPSPTGSGQITAPTVILEWEGRDPDGVVAGYRYRLDDRPWFAVGADCTRVRFTNLSTSEFRDDPRGKHTFSVLSIDEAGAVERFIEEPRNSRRWESVAAISGNLVISSNVMGSRSGVSETAGQIFAGTAVSFTWRGDASLYGGIILCYQYAYDQRQVFSGCDIGSTRFPADRPDFLPTIGSHALFVNAFDDAGQKIEATFPFVVFPVTTDKRILLVDDFDNGGTGGGTDLYPGDPMEDAFWDTVLAGYAHSGFDTRQEGDIPSIRIVAEASTLIWYVDDEDTWLDTVNRPEQHRNPMASYVKAGGNLILCGSLVTDPLTPDNYFVPEDLIGGQCLHRPQNTYRGGDRELNWFPAPCDEGLHLVYDVFQVSQSINEIAQQTLLGSIRSLRPDIVPDLALDLDKRGDDPGGVPLLRRGLEACEQYVLPGFPIGNPEAAIPLWTIVDVLGRERRVCGLLVPASARTGRGNVALLGFPPYYFRTDEMQTVFRALLDRFGEPRFD